MRAGYGAGPIAARTDADILVTMRRAARFADVLALAGLVAACERRATRPPEPAPRTCPEVPEPDADLRRAAVDALRGDDFEPLHAVELAAVVGSTCARQADGAVWCWGGGFTSDSVRGVPERVWLAGAATALDSDGHSRYCAVLDVGRVQCWTRTGHLETGVRAPPTAALTVAGSAVLLRRSDGSHVCWPFAGRLSCEYDGASPRGALVDGDVVCIWHSVSRASGGICESGRAVRLGPTPLRCADTDMSPACAAVRDGWPKRITHGEHTVVGPGSFGCALGDDGAIECEAAQPFGSTHLDRGRVAIALDEPATQLVMPHWGRHACALGRSGQVSCWGDNSKGAVGVAPSAGTLRPVAVAGLRDVVDIAGAEDTFCALDDSGGLWCWGALGHGLHHCPPRLRPTLIGRFDRPTALSVVSDGVCVKDAAGVRCVGFDLDDDRGCLVTPSGGVRCWTGTGPVEATYAKDARRVAVGVRSACALLVDRTVACWGEGDANLGRGYTAQIPEPLPVVKRR